MAGFAACSWPFWHTDDLTLCFRQDYLQTLLPLVVVGVSFLTLASRNISRGIARIRRGRGYQLIKRPERRANGIDGDDDAESPTLAGSDTDLPSDPSSPAYKAGIDGDPDGLTLNYGRLGLVKTTDNGNTIIQADAPPVRTFLNVVEELAVASLVAINAFAFATDAYDQTYYGKVTTVAGVTAWSYTLALTTLRLFLGNTSWRVPRLWNHTAAIYIVQWLISIVLFRSVLVHPPAWRLEQVLVVIDFALTSLLFLITILVRKGNEVVLLEWENGIPPSRENLASFWDKMTFSWIDPLIYAGWKTPLEMNTVWNLLPKDKASNILARWRALAKGSTLRQRLLSFFSVRLAAQFGWAGLGGALAFVPTLLLKAILEHIEQPDKAPKNMLWLYIILLPLTDMMRSFCSNQALWLGRKMCINVRAILIGEIYAKALRRKTAASKDKDMTDKTKGQGAGGDGDAAPKGLVAKLKRALGFKADKKQQEQTGTEGGTDADKGESEKGSDDEQANVGTIINLMSVDAFKVAELTAYLHMAGGEAPVMLTVAIFLLWRVMGLAAIPGLVVVVLMAPINLLMAKGLSWSQEQIMGATDKRIHVTNEVLTNIRIIKYFAWEARFANIIDEKRRAELARLRIRYLIWTLAVIIWNMVPIIITFFSFMVYTYVLGNELYPSVAFTAVSLFYLLRTPLDLFGDMIAHIQESAVSVGRIDSFLTEEETEKAEQLGLNNVDPQTGEPAIGFRDATFIWSGRDAITKAKDGPLAFRLMDLNVDFKIGKLSVVTGPTGCGKSSLLSALLGEMTILKGHVLCPGGRSREDVRPDPETGLAETCAYVAQQAWLVNGSIKENILFAAEYDEDRYASVVIACGLENDMEIFDDGDATLVGENGVSLSGGQKQRISLARAVYSNSRHVLLDDCLSAVDSHTAKWIFNNCIMGPLMRGRTCILVSHNIGLTTPHADLVVTMENGRVTGQGTSRELVAAGKLDRDILDEASPGSGHVSRVPSRVPSIIGAETAAVNEADNAAGPGSGSVNGNSGIGKSGKGGKFRGAHKSVGKEKRDVMAEDKAAGSVKWSVLKLYLGSLGGWLFWLVAIAIYIGQQLSIVGTNLWIKEWSNQYNAAAGSVSSPPTGFYMDTSALSVPGAVGAGSRTPLYGASSLGGGFHNGEAGIGNSSILAAAAEAAGGDGTSPVQPLPDVNVVYYLSILALIGVGGVVMVAFRDLWTFAGSIRASHALHDRLVTVVTRAKFRFFDVTPLGQMMNRFSRDLEDVDQSVAPAAIALIGNIMSVIITFAIITILLPGFVVAAVFICALYYMLATFYLHASRDLKRLESIARSPVFQQFGETLQGIMTIRAYGDERRFIRKNMQSINLQLRPYLYTWASNRWLSFRADVIGNVVAFSTGTIIATRLGSIDSGAAGLCLTYAIGFAESVNWFMRFYSWNERNMNAVERIKDYLEVEQEAPAVNVDARPPVGWPARGAVEFVDYATRYRKELDQVLRGVTLRIEPCEKVGIVGRTGAGKSSLTLAIFRALEADQGRILIDGIDVSHIGLQDLREAVTLVPQDPTLFMGTIRSNLDPFDSYMDEEIFTVLRRVQLIGPDELLESASQQQPQQGQGIATGSRPAASAQDAALTTANKNIFLDLSSAVTASGQNLAQGQRQLLCLARAMLRRPRVLVMDEATASIDYATDSKIQETIRDQLPGTTIITIAHRLKTIADYDKVVVLDRGRLVECGHPWELLQARKSVEVCATADDSGSGSDDRSSGSSRRVNGDGAGSDQDAAAAAGRGTFRAMCETSGDFDKLAATAKAAFRAKGLELVDVDVDEDVDEAAVKVAAEAQGVPLVQVDSPREDGHR